MRLPFLFVSASLALAIPASAASPANPDPTAVTAGSYVVEPTHTRIRFTVSHMGFTDWYGDLSGATGSLVLDPSNLASAKVDVSMPAASVLTINSKLDGELKGPAWLDAAQFPDIRFVSTKVSRTGASTADMEGDLTLHGITRRVTLKVKFNGAGINPLDKAYTVGFNGSTSIKRTDFGLNTYIPLIGDDVQIEISAAFEKKAA